MAPIPQIRNKWNVQGDFHQNWEKNLIAINEKMQCDYHVSMIATKHWILCLFDAEDVDAVNVPPYIHIIVAEFYVLPRCSSCGMYENLWLNIGDGFIGCGRKFYALSSLGGNGCSLTHYNEYKSQVQEHDEDHEQQESDLRKPASIAVKLGTISADGADVFDYEQQAMIFNARSHHDHERKESNDDNDEDISNGNNEENDESTPEEESDEQCMTLKELRALLQHWGIDMNRMYLYDKTCHSNQSILDDTFSKHAYDSFVNEPSPPKG